MNQNMREIERHAYSFHDQLLGSQNIPKPSLALKIGVLYGIREKTREWSSFPDVILINVVK